MSEPNKPHKRKLRNYLLDTRFQLRYAGMLFAVTALLSGALGFLLYRTSASLVAQSQAAVQSGQKAVQVGEQVAVESEKVSEVVAMNMAKVPDYADNPELLAMFREEQKEKDDVLATQQQVLRDEAAALSQQANAIESEQRTLLTTLFIVLALLAVGVGAMGIVFTHKVAGPIFKMTKQIREIEEGVLRVPAPLRKGDELEHFFGAFEAMVVSLRAQRERELEMLSELEQELGDTLSDEHRERLEGLRAELGKALEA